jgi:hypothetical protein
VSRPVRKGRRHAYGACEKGGDCLRCEAERAARARGVRVALVAKGWKGGSK